MANIQTDEARPPAADEGNFYNMVRVWYMVSETHTIFLKYKYGNNFTITIEKKILYGNQFSYHYHMKQYIVKIVTILPYNIYSGNILPTPAWTFLSKETVLLFLVRDHLLVGEVFDSLNFFLLADKVEPICSVRMRDCSSLCKK